MSERIAKFMARSGVCSRREAEELIRQKRVTVNGEIVASPALNVDGSEKILLDGEKLPAVEATRLWLYYKPVGLLTTHKDTDSRPTVFDNLPAGMPRVISVGRLDLNSEGLLLLTNNGELSRKLELPQNGWSRRYKVKVHGFVDLKKLAKLADGVTVDGASYGPVKAELESEQGTNAWLTVTLSEGKNREIRKLMKFIGLDVARLIRLSYGPFQLGSLKKGEVREVPGKVLKERAREALFNILHSSLEKDWSAYKLLDVFAGTGAFALEALSRGAAAVALIDKDTRSLEKNVALFPKEKERISVYRQNVLSLPPSAGRYDLLFMDAPYNQGLSEPALRELAAKGWLKPGALCLVEVEKNEQLHIPACYEWQEERIYGLAKVIFLKYVSGPQQ